MAPALRLLFAYMDCIDGLLSLVAIGGALAAGFCQVFLLIFLRDLLESSADAEAAGSVMPVSVANTMFRNMMLIAVGLFVSFFTFFSAGNLTASRQKHKWNVAALQAILRQDVGWFDVSNPQELASKVTVSVEQIYKGLEGPTYMLFQAVGQTAGGIAFGFFFDVQVTAVMCAMFPVVAVALITLVLVMNNSALRKIKAYSGADGIATESLFAMRTVASLGLEPEISRRFNENLLIAKKADISVASANGLAASLGLSSFLILLCAGFLFGGYRTAAELEASSYPYSVNVSTPGGPMQINYCAFANSTPTPAENFTYGSDTCAAEFQPWQMTCRMGELLQMFGDTELFGANTTALSILQQDSFATFRAHSQQWAPASYLETNPKYFGCEFAAASVILAVFAVMFGAMGIANVGPPLQNLGAGRVAAGELMAIVSRVPAVDSFDERGAKPEKVNGDIEVRDVVFAYPAAPEQHVCNGYSLSVKAGQTVALCGASGSGKSTIIQLIERFYDPLSGSVMLDGVDIKTLNVKWLRSQLGLVGQEPVLFMGSVYENIAYGKDGATKDDIVEAAKMANAHGFILEGLANGYDSQVGQGGSKLSGGQKQRVAIARAMIKKPAVLLLDEATSALDNESERIVQAALDEIMAKQKRTTIVIAHRLSTIRDADKIAVVSKGKVVEEGTYTTLLELGGAFTTLAKKQEEMAAQDKNKMKRVSSSNGMAPAPAPAAAAPVAEAVPSPSKREKRMSKEKRLSKEKGGSGAAAVDVEVMAADGVTIVKEGKEEEDPYAKGIARRVFQMQRESVPLFGMGIIFAFGSGGVPLIAFYMFPELLEVLLVELDPETVRSRTLFLCMVVIACCGGTIACFTLDSTCFGVAAARLIHSLRSKGMGSFMRQDIGFFDDEAHSAGELVSFLATRVMQVDGLTGASMQAVIRMVTAIVVLLVFCFAFGSWQMSLVLFFALPLMVVTMVVLLVVINGGKDGERKRRGIEEKGADATKTKSAQQILGEIVLGIRTVISFNAQVKFFEDFKVQHQGLTAADWKKSLGSAASLGGGMSMFQIVIACLQYYGAWLLSEQAITVKEFNVPLFMQFGGISVIVGGALGLKDTTTGKAAAQLLFKAIDRVPTIDNTSTEGVTLELTKGDIALVDVNFAYPTAKDHKVCNGYSLSIPAGQTVALCGASGSGKSTIIQLIERFYDPLSGSVMLDGVDIKTLNVKWLRSQLGLVGQEPVLFMGSVRSNIRYGKEGSSDDEVQEAAKMANAHGFIMEDLRNGYESDVGIRGGMLSGGQKQRVAIARALIRKPAVLLLDEATSALDNESERIVQAALDEIMARQKRTTIVIAHRLSTIRNADKIAVVQAGKVVEEGAHDDLLMNQEGLYYNLVLAQQ